jgi:hypothetical protein
MSRKRTKRRVARILATKKPGTMVELPPEPGRFFVLFPDDGISPGRVVTGTNFREDLPREIKRAEQIREDEEYVSALKRTYAVFNQREKH